MTTATPVNSELSGIRPIELKTALSTLLSCGFAVGIALGADSSSVPVWPTRPPGDSGSLPAEIDTTGANDPLVAGRSVQRISNVSNPELIGLRRSTGGRSRAAVIVCPGGGYRILALDLEGTEVASWLNGIGILGIVLKYRVPARQGQPPWLAAVQDIQRAVSLVRSRARELDVDPSRIGLCGFSAGANASGLAAQFGDHRRYEPQDAADRVSCRPNFGMLIYPAFFADPDGARLGAAVAIPDDMPPQFIVQACDDPVSPLNALLLATELKRHNVPFELHVYARGGHGFGLRVQADQPCTAWPAAAENWLKSMHILTK